MKKTREELEKGRDNAIAKREQYLHQAQRLENRFCTAFQRVARSWYSAGAWGSRRMSVQTTPPLWVCRGMIADFAIHLPDKKEGGIPNPHFHRFNAAIPITLVGRDALGLHLPDGYALMDGGQQVKPLPLIGAMVGQDWEPQRFCRGRQFSDREGHCYSGRFGRPHCRPK